MSEADGVSENPDDEVKLESALVKAKDNGSGETKRGIYCQGSGCEVIVSFVGGILVTITFLSLSNLIQSTGLLEVSQNLIITGLLVTASIVCLKLSYYSSDLECSFSTTWRGKIDESSGDTKKDRFNRETNPDEQSHCEPTQELVQLEDPSRPNATEVLVQTEEAHPRVTPDELPEDNTAVLLTEKKFWPESSDSNEVSTVKISEVASVITKIVSDTLQNEVSQNSEASRGFKDSGVDEGSDSLMESDPESKQANGNKIRLRLRLKFEKVSSLREEIRTNEQMK